MVSSKRKDNISLGLTEFQIRGKAYRKFLWEETTRMFGTPMCFDCDKELSLNEGVVMLDHGYGVLFFCDDCTLTRITLKETWNKVFGRCQRRK